MKKIKLKLSDDLKNAMKEKDEIAIRTIRSLISEIDNAGAVIVETPKVMPMSGGIAGATDGIGSAEVPRKELSETDIKNIIKKEIEEISNTIELVKQNSQLDTKQFTKQIEILENYLNILN
jgi:uncharacterized protein YqeY